MPRDGVVQPVDVGQTVVIRGAYLAVDDELMPGIGQLAERRPEQVGPIEAIAAAQGQTATPIGYRQETVTIVFDFVQPLRPARRFGTR